MAQKLLVCVLIALTHGRLVEDVTLVWTALLLGELVLLVYIVKCQSLQGKLVVFISAENVIVFFLFPSSEGATGPHRLFVPLTLLPKRQLVLVIREEIIGIIALIQEALAEPIPEPGKVAIKVVRLRLNFSHRTLKLLLLCRCLCISSLLLLFALFGATVRAFAGAPLMIVFLFDTEQLISFWFSLCRLFLAAKAQSVLYVAHIEALGGVIDHSECEAQHDDCVVDYEQADESDEDPAKVYTVCPNEATKDEKNDGHHVD